MRKIKLPQGEWLLDEAKPLGSPGGFGAVFEGSGVDGERVAIKRLNLTAPQVAYRELHVAGELLKRDLVHVLPFLDAGQDADSDQYFTVMPVAERDLQKEIDSRNAIPQAEALTILLSIVDGLLEVYDLVHRDLKPRNILLHDGRWKIADFGLARFLEESTSLNTVMEGMTAPYAAPEQWNRERASHATDVYALGCIAYALLTGKPPFQGPSRAEYKSQHLQASPPVLQNITPLFRSLLATMLRKQPQSRPELRRVREQLQKVAEAPKTGNMTAGVAALARAGAAHAEQTAAEEAATRLKTTVLNTRRQVSDEGFRILKDIFNEMVQRIHDTAPTASVQVDWSHGSFVVMGTARLSWDTWEAGAVIRENEFPHSKWDVYAGAFIRVLQKVSHYTVGFGSSLWYIKWNEHTACRWYEVSYMTSPYCDHKVPYEPFELRETKDADLATSTSMTHVYQRAFGPKSIDDEDMEDFLDRWLTRFAEASQGRLQRPGKLPLD